MTGYVFDIDDTLYCREDLLWKAVNEATGYVLSDRNQFIHQFYELSEKNLSMVERGEITAQESNIWRFEECFRLYGIPESAKAAADAATLYEDLQSRITVSRPLARLLDHLHAQGCPLAVLTNGETAHQWHKYDVLQLDRWIPKDRMIISGEVGFTKPDPAIFEIARERLAMDPGDLWMIGDSYESDITGASRCGWHTVWINRRNEPFEGPAPDLVFSNEHDMAEYLLRDPAALR